MQFETRTRTVLASLLAIPLFAAGALAAESKDKAKPKDCTGLTEAQRKAAGCEEPENPFLKAARGKAGEPVQDKVYGNDDLERLFGPPPAAEQAPAAEPEPGTESAPPVPPPDPGNVLAEIEEQRKQAEERAAVAAEAEKKITDLRDRLASLERAKIAVHNPLLARPEAPEGHAAEWDKMSGTERVTLLDSLIDATRRELEQAEQARGAS
jgi:hypothetical protein